MGTTPSKNETLTLSNSEVRYEKRIVIEGESFTNTNLALRKHLVFSNDGTHQWQIYLQLDKFQEYIDVVLEMYLNASIEWSFLATVKCCIYKRNYDKTHFKKTPRRMKFHEGVIYVFEKFLKYDVDLWRSQKYIFPENVIVLKLEFKEHDNMRVEKTLEPGRMAYFDAMRAAAIHMYNKALLTDCTIYVIKEGILAHRIVLSAVSNVFRKIFAIGSTDPKFKAKIDLSEYSFKIVKSMVDFAYYGPLIYVEQDALPELIQLAHDLQFRHLKAFCEHQLVKQINASNRDYFADLGVKCHSVMLFNKTQEFEESNKKHKTIKAVRVGSAMSYEKEDKQAVELAKRLLENSKITGKDSQITIRTNSSSPSFSS